MAQEIIKSAFVDSRLAKETGLVIIYIAERLRISLQADV